MSSVEVRFFQPPAILADKVVGIRTIVHTKSQPAVVKTCPNGTPGVIFQLGEDGSKPIKNIMTRSHNVTNIPTLFLHGQRPEPSVMKFRAGSYTIIQVVLKPQALYTLFGMDASILSQKLLSAAQFGAEELQEQLLAKTNLKDRVTLLESFLLGQHKIHNQTDDMVGRALELIHVQVRYATVKSVLGQLHVPERQLQKHFLRAVGCSPQEYIRIRRVNEALQLIRNGDYKKLSDVAYALQYYDQSHFIRDIKALSWLTPKDIAQSVNDFRQDESGVSYI